MAKRVCTITAGGNPTFNPDPVPVKRRNHDTITWQCATSAFSITQISPSNPFAKALPFNSTANGGMNVAESGDLSSGACTQLYKCTVSISGVTVDPHIDVDAG